MKANKIGEASALLDRRKELLNFLECALTWRGEIQLTIGGYQYGLFYMTSNLKAILDNELNHITTMLIDLGVDLS